MIGREVPPASSWPIDALDRRLAPVSAAPIAVAFSGGGDSLAALLATKTWADRAGRRVIVLTVDHRLQPQSSDWQCFAQAVARRIGAGFEPLVWVGDKPTTGIAAAARAARHRLIAGAARRHGARGVVDGHTADDLAEAALMRAEGSGVGSPREWSPSPIWPEGRGIFLLRPLLDQRRAAIRAALTQAGEVWIDDPANENPASLRARARCTLGSLDLSETVAAHRTDDGSHRLIRGDVDAPRDRYDPSSRAAGRLPPQGERAVLYAAAGALNLGRETLRNDAERHVLGAAMTCAGGGNRPSRGDRLLALTRRLACDGDVTATLVGAKLIAHGDQVLVVRNAGEAARGGLAPLHLESGETAVWDGRFEFTAGPAPVIIEPLAGHARALAAPARVALKPLAAAVRAALPSYVDPDGRRICPILAHDPSVRVRSLVADRFAAATGMISKEPAA